MAKLYYRYSTMNAGKSTALLQVAHNYTETGRRVRLFTAEIDDRYGVGLITSRLGVQREAEVFNLQTNFWGILEQDSDLACVLVDEAQFLDANQVRQLHMAAHHFDIPVICYGLRTDFQGNAFPGSSHLLALADTLEEIKTVCDCGKKASMVIRTDAAGHRVTEGSQVEIGGNSRYKPVCPKCFYIPKD
jgi:thymidine kinase